MSLSSWFQLNDYRTTLLQLQFLYSSLKQRTELQKSIVERSHADRLIQYYQLWEDYLQLEQSNFKKIIIMKLESCLDCHQQDHAIWQIIDAFVKYVKMVEQGMREGSCKIWIGKGVMFDIQAVELALSKIDEMLVNFIQKYSSSIKQYKNNLSELQLLRNLFKSYCTQVAEYYQQLPVQYQIFIKRKVQAKRIDLQKRIDHLKRSLKNY